MGEPTLFYGHYVVDVESIRVKRDAAVVTLAIALAVNPIVRTFAKRCTLVQNQPPSLIYAFSVKSADDPRRRASPKEP